MTDATVPEGPALIAMLNDLLALDHDAVQAYSIAIGRISRPEYREVLAGFRGDHQRHIDQLTQLIRDRGGVPVQLPHLPTGVFKLAMQALATLGDDRAVLMAFKTNEGQVRDRYRRAADQPHEPAAGAVISTAALDEERHYAWAEQVLARMGVHEGTLLGGAQAAAEKVQGRVIDAVEDAGRRVAEAVERIRPGGAKEPPTGA
ncbi:MAG TPA: ferritin-like domain-containing protein [Longimicrobium sp.]|nr:ferritin-like domain-containing protein [Longimicrobium sp.]